MIWKKSNALYLFADLLAVFAAFFAAYFSRDVFSPKIQSISFYYVFVAVSAAAFLLGFYFFRLYDKNRHLFSISFFVDFLRALSFWGVFLLAFSFFSKIDYSRAVVVLFFVFAFVFVYFFRLFLAWILGIRSERLGDKEMVIEAGRLIRLCDSASGELSTLTELCVRRAPGGLYRVGKRTMDVCFSCAGILVFLAAAPFVVFFIRRDSPGRSFLRQARTGKDGREFCIYKFRTMFVDAPLYEEAPRDDGDARVTRAGRFLRKYSLDELPQLVNVLKGEMSLVGPRPEMPFIVERYEPWQKMRLSVKPGITGLWQILGRKDLPLHENMEYDLYYVFNQSLFLDMAIMLRTLPHLIFPHGAY